LAVEAKMRGVQFLVDDPELWEDLYDRTLVKTRRKEPRESLETVKRRLVSRKRLGARG